MSGSQFGIIGLGTMGRNLALNIEEHGFPVAVWNLETEWIARRSCATTPARSSRATTTFEASPRRWSGRGGS